MKNYVPLQQHLEPIELAQIQKLLKTHRAKSALPLAYGFNDQVARKKAYQNILFYTVLQTPEYRNSMIEEMVQKETIRTNTFQPILNQCENFKRFPGSRKRQAAEAFTSIV